MADGTILVNLRKDWFSPDGSLYRAIDNPHEFPAAFADKPPKDAPEAQKYAVLPSTAELVESSKTVVDQVGGKPTENGATPAGTKKNV